MAYLMLTVLPHVWQVADVRSMIQDDLFEMKEDLGSGASRSALSRNFA